MRARIRLPFKGHFRFIAVTLRVFTCSHFLLAYGRVEVWNQRWMCVGTTFPDTAQKACYPASMYPPHAGGRGYFI